MSLREEMWRYEQITGESAEHVPIIKLGAFLDGYDMGIKTLEQQPCDDCISRKDTLDKINTLIAEYIPLMPIGWTLPLNIAKTINELPSVTPQPCEEQSGTVQLHDPLIDEVVKSGAPFKKWLESFNTESASVCFNKIQELKGIVGAGSEKNTQGVYDGHITS